MVLLTRTRRSGTRARRGPDSNRRRGRTSCSLSEVDRTLHALDVENLCGTPAFSKNDLEEVQSSYEEVAPGREQDHVIVASSHFGAGELWFEWQGNPRRLTRSGPDGADLCLLEVIHHEQIAEKYSTVVIGSGDGIFAPSCRYLAMNGVAVVVVARNERSLSSDIRRSANDIRLLNLPDQTPPDNGKQTALCLAPTVSGSVVSDTDHGKDS